MKLASEIFVALMYVFGGAIMMLGYDMTQTRKTAIQYGCGGYAHDTGEFQWEQVSVPPIPKEALVIKEKGHQPTLEDKKIVQEFFGTGKSGAK